MWFWGSQEKRNFAKSTNLLKRSDSKSQRLVLPCISCVLLCFAQWVENRSPREEQITQKQRYTNSMRDARIYDIPTRAHFSVSSVLQYSQVAPERAKKHARWGAQITKKQRYTKSMTYARIYEKLNRGVYKLPNILVPRYSSAAPERAKNMPNWVHKSPRNSGTRIPWETLEYTKNPPGDRTNYPISLVLQYSKAAPE